ncbi:MAG: N-acetylmuramic acid 6-phosphate etherase [Phycisphaerales bacterium]|nr:N-acetylmuramic acid 6-phosphate etherase [Phycisphaerales bacterium]
MTDPDPCTQPPPDRAHVATEHRNPRSTALHTLPVAGLVRLINEEDASVAHALRRAEPALTRLITAAEPGFAAGGRLVYIGAGTSGRLGVLDASEAPPTFCVEPGRIVGIIAGGDAALRRSSEGMEDDRDGARAALTALGLNARDTVIGIAAGGTTPYVLGGLTIAKRPTAAPLTALIACAPMARPSGADHLIVLNTGPEVLTGSTRMKAGTATKLALNTISTTLMVRTGRVYQNLMVDLCATNDKLLDRAARVVSALTGLPRADALALLARAGRSVKTAVVMHRRSLSLADAEGRLAAAAGNLGCALDRD